MSDKDKNTYIVEIDKKTGLYISLDIPTPNVILESEEDNGYRYCSSCGIDYDIDNGCNCTDDDD